MWAVWPGIPVALVKCMDVSSREVTCSIGASFPFCSLTQSQLPSYAMFVCSVSSPHNEKQQSGV